MKISYNWLKQFIKLDWDAEKAGELNWIEGKVVLNIFDELQASVPYQKDPWLSSVPKEAKEIVHAGHGLHEFNYASKNKLSTEERAADSELKSLMRTLTETYGAH